jgi:WD40 repeat-containing protein SMU1
MLMMESAVLALGISLDSQYLVAGAQNGKIKVWKIKSGQLMRKIPDAHTQGVTSVSFNKDTSQILSTSFDHTIRYNYSFNWLGFMD